MIIHLHDQSEIIVAPCTAFCGEPQVYSGVNAVHASSKILSRLANMEYCPKCKDSSTYALFLLKELL